MGTDEQKKMLSPWPVIMPSDYLSWLHEPQTKKEEEALERSTSKDKPYGSDTWVSRIVKKFGLEQTLRGVGRPKRE